MQNYVQTLKRIIWLAALSVLGLIPILLAVTWVDGNMTLPGEIHRLFQSKFSWPWLSFEESSVGVRALIDVALTAVAYLLTILVTTQVGRKLTTIVLGVSLFSVMSSWQYTGIIVWAPSWPSLGQELLVGDRIFYYVMIASAAWQTFSKIPPFELLRPSRGILPFFLALFLTSVMSLDRLLFSLVTISFITILFKFRLLAKPTNA